VAHQGYDNRVSINEQWLLRYTPWVRRLAHHMVVHLPDHVDPDDLIQVGLMGLMDAGRQYEARNGASFETYARTKIRGAMLDELRRNDWAPRSVSLHARMLREARAELEQKNGHRANELELAKHLRITLDQCQQWIDEVHQHALTSIEQVHETDDAEYDLAYPLPALGHLPENVVDRRQMLAILAGAVDQLPERDRLVLSLYYEKDLTLKEIGAVLGVSVSRVSQIHSKAVARLRVILRTDKGENGVFAPR